MYCTHIEYNRDTRDYGMYLDGELIGFARTYQEAKVTLAQLVCELLSGNYRCAGGSETLVLELAGDTAESI